MSTSNENPHGYASSLVYVTSMLVESVLSRKEGRKEMFY